MRSRRLRQAGQGSAKASPTIAATPIPELIKSTVMAWVRIPLPLQIYGVRLPPEWPP